MVVTSKEKSFQGDDILPALREMFGRNFCDNGLIFIRKRMEINFRSSA